MDEKLILTKRPNDEAVLMEVLSKAPRDKYKKEEEQKLGEEFTAAQAYVISKNNSKSSTKKNAQWLELP